MLEVKNLSIEAIQDGSQKLIVKDISFSIEKGKSLILMGRSGVGKSSIVNSISGLLPKGLKISSGKIMFNDRNLLEFHQKEFLEFRKKRLGFIFQDIHGFLNPLFTVRNQIESLWVLKTNGESPEKLEIESLIKSVELDIKCLDMYSHQLSGGMKQRLSIAMALVGMPEIVIADEPTSALDFELRESILELILNLQQRYQFSLIIITHDRSIVEKLDCNYIHLDKTDIEGLDINVRHPTTVASKNINISTTTLYEIDKIKVSFESNSFFSKKTINTVINEASFKIFKGEILGIMGPSGTGKSCLCRALIGKQSLKEGKIFFKGQDINELDSKSYIQFLRKSQIVLQDSFGSLNPKQSAFECVYESLMVSNSNLDDDQMRVSVLKMLSDVGIQKSDVQRLTNTFSGGQKQRINLARSLIASPECLILDEPFSSLDTDTESEILNLIFDLKSKFGLTILIISHNKKTLFSICDRILELRNSKVTLLAR